MVQRSERPGRRESGNRNYSNGTGNLSNTKSVGGGIQEYRIDFGPGYRIYLGRDGERLVILLGGGTKKRQRDDIHRAQNLWADYRRRKKEEE
jgi:putative addiction module killer protein